MLSCARRARDLQSLLQLQLYAFQRHRDPLRFLMHRVRGGGLPWELAEEIVATEVVEETAALEEDEADVEVEVEVEEEVEAAEDLTSISRHSRRQGRQDPARAEVLHSWQR